MTETPEKERPDRRIRLSDEEIRLIAEALEASGVSRTLAWRFHILATVSDYSPRGSGRVRR